VTAKSQLAVALLAAMGAAVGEAAAQPSPSHIAAPNQIPTPMLVAASSAASAAMGGARISETSGGAERSGGGLGSMSRAHAVALRALPPRFLTRLFCGYETESRARGAGVAREVGYCCLLRDGVFLSRGALLHSAAPIAVARGAQQSRTIPAI
jgi:hypothetical protein